MSCVNLFALVQVAVVINFGLLFITTDNFYNSLKKESIHYINSLTTNTIKFAEGQLHNVPPHPRDITVRLNKADTEYALHRLKGITNVDGVNSYYLACWGVFAGVYCIAFLFAMAFENTGAEIALKNTFISLAIIIVLFGVLSYYLLRDSNMSETKARYQIVHLLRRFVKYGVPISLPLFIVFVFFDCPFFRYLHAIIPISVIIAYFPSIWVVIRLFWRLHKIRIFQKACWDSAGLLKKALEG